MERQESIEERAAPPGTPLFLLSFRQRDELAAIAVQGGWRLIAARRAEGVARRFHASGAAVAVIDARGAVAEGLAAAEALGPVAEARGGALLVLLSRGEEDRLGAFYAAGATHFLTSPMRPPEFLHALRFAARHAERMGATGDRRGGTDTLGWRYDPGLGTVQLTPALAQRLDLPPALRPRTLIARLSRPDRRLACAAIRRLAAGETATAFAHEVSGIGRVVEHLQRDSRTGRTHALVEPLGSAPDPGAILRDAIGGVRDAGGLRLWVERRLAGGTPVALLRIALTRFDTVNTAYGRAAGDALLRSVEQRIGSIAREAFGRSLVSVRDAGASFLIAVECGDAALLRAVADRISAALAGPGSIGPGTAPLGARLGIAIAEAGDDWAALTRRAEEGLRNEAGASVLGSDRLAAEIRHALDRDQIEIRFQPQASVTTGAIVGVEALARWRHPELGELGAQALLEAGERAGLEIALSAHIQQAALHAAARWPEALSALRLSINVTAADVAQADFAERLLARVDAARFPRARLTVEITESGLIEELGEAARLLSDLRHAGCRVAIDDFGTGYSSLAYLKALPLDYLKIDRKLSQDIEGSPRDRVVVRGVIEMARSLDLTVIAEGVETPEQLDLLAREGCQLFQGFLCAEPLTVEALAGLVGR